MPIFKTSEILFLAVVTIIRKGDIPYCSCPSVPVPLVKWEGSSAPQTPFSLVKRTFPTDSLGVIDHY